MAYRGVVDDSIIENLCMIRFDTVSRTVVQVVIVISDLDFLILDDKLKH